MKDAYANQYRDLWTHHWWWQARRRFILGMVGGIAHRHSIRKILDIGCGDGLFMEDLSRFGSVHGIEPDRRLLSPDNPHRDRIQITPFGPQFHSGRRYDLVVMLDVLEHIEDDEGALRVLRRTIYPGGFALLTVPALPALWSMHDEANCHYRRYTRKLLQRKLQATGFEVIRLNYFFGWTILPLFVRRAISGRKASRIGEPEQYRVQIPSYPVNMLMRWLSVTEQFFSAGLGLPLGSSLIAVLRSPELLQPMPVMPEIRDWHTIMLRRTQVGRLGNYLTKRVGQVWRRTRETRNQSTPISRKGSSVE